MGNATLIGSKFFRLQRVQPMWRGLSTGVEGMGLFRFPPQALACARLFVCLCLLAVLPRCRENRESLILCELRRLLTVGPKKMSGSVGRV